MDLNFFSCVSAKCLTFYVVGPSIVKVEWRPRLVFQRHQRDQRYSVLLTLADGWPSSSHLSPLLIIWDEIYFQYDFPSRTVKSFLFSTQTCPSRNLLNITEINECLSHPSYNSNPIAIQQVSGIYWYIDGSRQIEWLGPSSGANQHRWQPIQRTHLNHLFLKA